jgi:hypothetical protein
MRQSCNCPGLEDMRVDMNAMRSLLNATERERDALAEEILSLRALLDALEHNRKASRIRELEGQIAGEAAFQDSRLRYVEIQVDRDIWIECCKKHCPDAPWFQGALK